MHKLDTEYADAGAPQRRKASSQLYRGAQAYNLRDKGWVTQHTDLRIPWGVLYTGLMDRKSMDLT